MIQISLFPEFEKPETYVASVNSECKKALKIMHDNGIKVDSIVTDPPYELGFMGKSWDKTGIAYDKELWELCLSVIKPGGHLLAFAGSRTYHRMACAIEDAGFEIRDQIMWVYGQGFPKSLNVSKAIDKMAGAERDILGLSKYPPSYTICSITAGSSNGGVQGGYNYKNEFYITAPSTEAAKRWDGWGSALKPAHEPIVMARKPLSEKNIALNVLEHGTGAINLDGCRVTSPENHQGRFPANLIHDGSNEIFSEFSRFFYSAKASKKDRCGSKHPTVKPIALMRYLCRLITPKGGVVLDPFAGTGTTGKAAQEEGLHAVLIEKDETYFQDILRRIYGEQNQAS